LSKAFENLGSAKATKGDLEGAIADYDQAIQLDPKNFEAFEKRALTRQLKGDFEGALSDLIYCDELAPPGESRDYAHLYSWLVRVRRGQTAEANRGACCLPRQSAEYDRAGLGFKNCAVPS
jgi:tetratricopeptide (TPR) repeat protein